MPELRIHFTQADLGRTRLSMRMDHMWEIVSATQLLQHREGGLYFDSWRRTVRDRVQDNPQLRRVLQTIVCIAPHATYFPDFLTPAEECDTLDDALDCVVSAPKRQLRTEMALLSTLPAPLRAIADGGAAALRGLRAALAGFHHAIIEPELDTAEAAWRSDVAHRMHLCLHDGIEAVLAQVCAGAVWRPPVLTLPYAVDRDLFLHGRGLRLVPSYFSLLHPVALADPALPPTLVIPIDPAARLLTAPHRQGDRLGALLGSTRAAILRMVLDGCSTRDLIRRIGIAPATVTHHTTVLRDAGMIATYRDGGGATHRITQPGIHVLSANG